MKKEANIPTAHILAVISIIVWGTTFIASKKLLVYYTPVQIMLMRFAIAYFVLWILRPKLLRLDIKAELGCVFLSLFGCTVYFLAENYALTYTYAANVSILVAAAPILTAILSHFFSDEKLNKNIFIGFIIAITGVALVVFNGTVILKLSPLGDILSIGAALCWAVYSVFLKKYLHRYDNLLLTRRIMLWGFITSLPVQLIKHDPFPLEPLKNGTVIFCFLFLGILGSGLCYVMWNFAIQKLGTVVTNNYIYVIPFATMLAAGIFLDEPVSAMAVGGAVLILLGVFLAGRKSNKITKKAD